MRQKSFAPSLSAIRLAIRQNPGLPLEFLIQRYEITEQADNL